MPEDTKNTLKNTQSTKPGVFNIPPKNPGFNQFRKPNFGSGKSFTQSFRTQSRGSGGK